MNPLFLMITFCLPGQLSSSLRSSTCWQSGGQSKVNIMYYLNQDAMPMHIFGNLKGFAHIGVKYPFLL